MSILQFTISIGTSVDEVLIPLTQPGGLVEILTSILGDIEGLGGHEIVHQAPRYVAWIRGK